MCLKRMKVVGHSMREEDHNHVLKRISGCFRLNPVPNVDTRAFVGAMNKPHTGLTYTALTGKRKQSVPDAETLLSAAVADWCKSNNYPEEGRVIEVIANWHKASDGRGFQKIQGRSTILPC